MRPEPETTVLLSCFANGGTDFVIVTSAGISHAELVAMGPAMLLVNLTQIVAALETATGDHWSTTKDGR